jgi:phosphoglycolate phosphatase
MSDGIRSGVNWMRLKLEAHRIGERLDRRRLGEAGSLSKRIQTTRRRSIDGLMPLIVFDLDGTLIDSQRDIAESTNEMLESYGAEPLPIEDVARMVGEGAKVLVGRALITAGLRPDVAEAFDRFLRIYDRRLLNHTVPYPGITEVVESAAGRASLALLSNKPEAPTRRLLEAFDLARHFTWTIGGDSAFPRKPDPASLRYLMTEAAVTTTSTLFVGDSMIDVQTARGAGVRLCVVLYGFGALRGDLVLSAAEKAGAAEHAPGLARAIDQFLAAVRLSGRV